MESGTVIIAGLSLFLGLLFAIFVVVMFYDQISCIIENLSTIDKLLRKKAMQEGKKVQEEEKPQRTWWQNVCEVMTGRCNQGFDIFWLIPTDIEYPLFLENEY